MSRPIRLWRPRQTRTDDDAGITILKSTLPQASQTAAPYEIAAREHGKPSHLPSLTYFCVQSLLDYPDQVYTLGSLRFNYRPPSSPGAHDILRELIPSYRTDNPLDMRLVDPRLWALLTQLYHGLPPQFRSYTLPLADHHLTLLQRIPPTVDFALVTTLALPGCEELTDENVVLLKDLHSLCAFDASGTALSAWAVKVLAKTLTTADEEDVVDIPPSANRRGPWGLRILSLRDCMNVNSDVFAHLPLFPLLSVVDVRGTRCKSSKAKDFRHCEDAHLFYPATLPDALSALNSIAAREQCPLYSHSPPYFLNVLGLQYGKLSIAERRSLRAMDLPNVAPSIGTRRDVFLPPACDAASSLPLHRRLEATARPNASRHSSDDQDLLDIRCDCSGCVNDRICERENAMAAAALEEGFQGARRISVMKFYEQPMPTSRVPRATKRSGSRTACKPDDRPLMLFRFPPAWSLLPSPEAGSVKMQRKKAKLDPPLADARTLSADGVRERAEVKTAVTALHASLKERQVSHDAALVSATAESSGEAARKVSSNPFARSTKSKSNDKTRVTSRVEAQASTSSVPAKRTLSDCADAAPVSTLSFKSSLPATTTKKLKPISQLPVPPLPPEARAQASATRRRVSSSAAPSAKKTQAMLDPSLLAASKRTDCSAGFRPTSTLTPKNLSTPTTHSKPSSTKSKSKTKSRSTAFDWTAWGS